MKRLLTAAFALSLMAGASAFAQDQSSMPAPAAPAPAADQSSAPMAPAATADTPAGSPPATYPVCTHKGEDRCMQRGGAHEESDAAKMHHMKKKMHHMKKKMKAMKAGDTTAAPAAEPAGNTTGPGL